MKNRIIIDFFIVKNMYNLKKMGIVILLPILFASCYSSKQLNYLQSNEELYTMRFRKTEYKVQPNDVLNINIQSRDPDQSIFFNSTNGTVQNFQANPATFFATGHSINEEGNINLAIVGELKVGGLTVDEIQDLVQTEINDYLVNAVVTVKLTSFKISVLGDVKNPGTNYVFNAQSNIFEALSAAGDLNLSAKRKNIKLIRQGGDKSTVVTLDLRDPTIINSPYYFLHPNDVIFVETSEPNILRNNLPVITVILSAISTTVLIANFVSSN